MHLNDHGEEDLGKLLWVLRSQMHRPRAIYRKPLTIHRCQSRGTEVESRV